MSLRLTLGFGLGAEPSSPGLLRYKAEQHIRAAGGSYSEAEKTIRAGPAEGGRLDLAATEPGSVPGVRSSTGCGGFLVSPRGASCSFTSREDPCQAACAPRVDGTVRGWQGACRRQTLRLGSPTCLHG